MVSDVVSKFTIGDGKKYNGHHNAPLEPGTTYNIRVRAVTKAQNGVSIKPLLKERYITRYDSRCCIYKTG